MGQCYAEFRQAIDSSKRGSIRAKCCGIATEYQILVTARRISGEIEALRNVFKAQYAAVQDVFRWAERVREKNVKAAGSSDQELGHATSEDKDYKHEIVSGRRKLTILRSRFQRMADDVANLVKSVRILPVCYFLDSLKLTPDETENVIEWKQKQAPIVLADSAALQGNIVMVFTAVTIIFVRALATVDPQQAESYKGSSHVHGGNFHHSPRRCTI